MADGYQAFVEVLPDFKDFTKKANSEMSSVLGSAGTSAGALAGKNVGGGILAGIPKIAGPAIAAVAALGIGNAIGDAIGAGINYSLNSIDLASNLNESLNASKVTFGADIAKQLEKLGADAPQRLALTRNAFAGLTVQFGAFAKQIRGNDVVGFLDELTTRGADFASVYNLEVNDALSLFQSGLAGETEPLRKFGLDLSAASVEAYAYRTGIAEVGAELTEGEKVQARYGALLEQTAQVQGDNAATADEYAGALRRLNVKLEEAQTGFGQALLPTAIDIVTFANDDLLPIITDALEKAGPALSQSIEDVLPEIKELIGTAADNLPAAIEGAIGAASFLADSFNADFGAGNGGIFDPEVWERTEGFFNDYLPRWAEGSVSIEESWEGFFNYWDLAWDGVANTVQNKSDQTKAYWQKSVDGMKAIAAEASLVNEGYNLAQGFADGIETNSEAAELAVERMALRTVSKAQNVLRIQSPSRVFMEIGNYTAQGYIDGLMNRADDVERATVDMIGSVSPSSIPASVSFGSAGVAAGSSSPVSVTNNIELRDEDPQVVGNKFGRAFASQIGSR